MINFCLLQAVLDTLFLGNLTIVPHHTILLDKARCDPPHIILVAPPSAPPSPTPPPPSFPETCQAFYDIIRNTFSEQFFCRAKRDCEAGLECTLEILDTFYRVDITIDPEAGVIVFRVADSDGRKIGSEASKNTTVSLPRPASTSLIFNQSVSAKSRSVGFSVRWCDIDVHTCTLCKYV